MELMQGLVPHGYGASRIVSSSLEPVAGELWPPSDGSRQSLCPAKFATFSRRTHSHTVVIAPVPIGSTLHVHVCPPHVPHPTVPPSACAKQAAAAARVGWQ